MLKVIKETAIMLLICLVGILLFAVLFYEYIPARKDVPEVVQYSPTSTVSEQLSDSVDELNENVVSTFENDKDAYQVTSTDLNRYKATKAYNPGKSNPFEETSSEPKGNSNTIPTGKSATSDDKSETGNSNSGSKSSSKNSSKTNNTSTNEESSYIRNKGTK